MTVELYQQPEVLDDLKENYLFLSITVDPGTRWTTNDAGSIWSRYPGQVFLLPQRLLGEREDLAVFLAALGYNPRQVTQELANVVAFDNYTVRPDFLEEQEKQRNLERRQWLYYGQINGRTVQDLFPLPPPRPRIPSVAERLAMTPPDEYLNVSGYNRAKGTGISRPRPRPYLTGGTLKMLYPGDGDLETIAFPFGSNNLHGYLGAISTVPNARTEHSDEISTFITMFDIPEKKPKKKRSVRMVE